jgi:hypothetical protein
LIAADNHVATLRVGEQLPQARTTEKIIARATIVDVVDHWLIGEAHTSEVLGAALLLHVEAELLLAFVILGAASVRADDHRVLGSESDGSKAVGVVGRCEWNRVPQRGSDEHACKRSVQQRTITDRVQHDDRRS